MQAADRPLPPAPTHAHTCALRAAGLVTHLVSLPLELLTVVVLHGLQVVQPLPQLLGLVPGGVERSPPAGDSLVTHKHRRCSHRRCSPQLVLAQVVDVERLASLCHDLLLLLPLGLLLASLCLCLEERNSGQSQEA